MTGQRANVRASAPVRIGLLLVAVAAMAAAAATARWERQPEIFPGFTAPAYSQLAYSERDEARDVCTFDLVTEGLPDEVRAAYDDRLRAAGWTEASRSGDRINYERGEATARVAVRIPTATEPGWSRVRIVVTPCAS